MPNVAADRQSVSLVQNPEEKQAVVAIQDISGIGETSAQAIIAVIGK